MGYNMRDPEAAIDSMDPALHNTGYGGGAATGTALDLSSIDSPKGIVVYYKTANGTAGDTIDINLQHSSDDGSTDAYTDVPDNADLATLNDASGFNAVALNASDFKKWIRLDLASGDQTVDSTIDVVGVFVAVGAFQSGTL